MRIFRSAADKEKIVVTFLKKNRTTILAIAAVVLLYAVFSVLNIGCPIKFTTGVSCAGCGMTRAWQSVFRLDLNEAFGFHPLFWTIPVIAVLFFLKNRFPRVFRVTACVVAALFIVVYFIRMFDHSCDIVVFEPKNSIFYRIVHHLM